MDCREWGQNTVSDYLSEHIFLGCIFLLTDFNVSPPTTPRKRTKDDEAKENDHNDYEKDDDVHLMGRKKAKAS